MLPVNEMRGRRESAAMAAPTSAPPFELSEKGVLGFDSERKEQEGQRSLEREWTQLD